MKSTISTHRGESLFHMANEYPNLLGVIREAVQNALDADATEIEIIIDHRKRTISIRDNGNGVSRDDFDKALMQVCSSVKTEGKLGQFGIGLIAPLGKCENFTFTSSAKPQSGTATNPYFRWLFVSEDIRKQSEDCEIPLETLTIKLDHQIPKATDDKKQKTYHKKSNRNVKYVWWRTEVMIHKFTSDRTISTIDIGKLRGEITAKFSLVMRQLGTVIVVQQTFKDEKFKDEITAEVYSGDPLPIVTLDDNEKTGQTTFKLFVANKTGSKRSGKVYVLQTDHPYRIEIGQFLRGPIPSEISPEVKQALLSGAFEGEIITTGAKLSPNRKEFEENDALLHFCISIENWYEKYGEDFFIEFRGEEKDLFYQAIGKRSLEVISAMLRMGEFSLINDVLKNIVKVGSVGKGHARTDHKQIGEQDVTSVSVDGAHKGSSEPTDTEPREYDEPEKDHPGHGPFTVAGPKGSHRTRVKGDSIGLQLQYDEMPGTPDLWVFDRHEGVLHFNVRHPLWAKAEANDQTLMRFQEYIAIQALCLEIIPESQRQASYDYIMASLPAYLFLLMKGDIIAKRHIGTVRRRKKVS